MRQDHDDLRNIAHDDAPEDWIEAEVQVSKSPFDGLDKNQIHEWITKGVKPPSGETIPQITWYDASKDTNPKDAVGIAKAPLSVIPQQVLLEVGLAMMEGARKYGAYNYRDAGVRASVYYDATMRHLIAWWEGQDQDPDSGLSHITKAITSLMVLRDAAMNDMVNDDRPPRAKNFDQKMVDANAAAKAIIVRYPECKTPYTEKGKANV